MESILFLFFLVVGLALGVALGKIQQRVSDKVEIKRLTDAIERRDEELTFLGQDVNKL